MSIRAITFDFWSTLFRDANTEERHAFRVNAFSEATNTPPEEVAEALHVAQRELLRSHIEDQRTLTPAHAVRLIAVSLGISLARDVIDDLAKTFGTAIVVHSPLPIDGALEAVRASAEHVPVGILSDTGMSPGSSLRQLLDRHGFLRLFRSLTFSDEVGVAKPQRPMFETAARGLGVEPAELLHIGDLEPTDVVGAKSVGAKAALFIGENARHRESTTADYVFTEWLEFIDVLPFLV